MLQEINGNFLVVSNFDKFLAKFQSGTLKVIDSRRLMSLFQLLLEHSLEFVFRRISLAVQAKAAKSPEAIFLCQHRIELTSFTTLPNCPKIIDLFSN